MPFFCNEPWVTSWLDIQRTTAPSDCPETPIHCLRASRVHMGRPATVWVSSLWKQPVLSSWFRKIKDSFFSTCSGLWSGPSSTFGVSYCFPDPSAMHNRSPLDSLTLCGATDFKCCHCVIRFLMFCKPSSSLCISVYWLIISSFRASITSLRGQRRWCLNLLQSSEQRSGNFSPKPALPLFLACLISLYAADLLS